MSGVTQSEALTRAAQKLSTARARLREAEALRVAGEIVVLSERYRDAVDLAEAAYRAAYVAYTNPFGVRKTHG